MYLLVVPNAALELRYAEKGYRAVDIFVDAIPMSHGAPSRIKRIDLRSK